MLRGLGAVEANAKAQTSNQAMQVQPYSPLLLGS
jgi:hypothetical protein